MKTNGHILYLVMEEEVSKIDDGETYGKTPWESLDADQRSVFEAFAARIDFEPSDQIKEQFA